MCHARDGEVIEGFGQRRESRLTVSWRVVCMGPRLEGAWARGYFSNTAWRGCDWTRTEQWGWRAGDMFDRYLEGTTDRI